MKIARWAFIAWSLIATVLVVRGYHLGKNYETATRSFCAYGRVFVEFEENGKVWGSIMLDMRGKPIPCKEDYNNSDPSTDHSIEYKGYNI
jgi:hypothetical protein